MQGATPIVGEWRYSDQPPGYELGECSDLKKGETYMVYIRGSGSGTAVFKIDPTGRPEVISGDCS
jgi:hypothetical protein